MLLYLLQIDRAVLVFFNRTVPHTICLNLMGKMLDFASAKGLIWLIICLIAILSKQKKYKLFGFWGLINLALLAIFEGLIVKALIARPRPFIEMDSVITDGILPVTGSFPSGHTAVSVSMALLFWLMLPQTKVKYLLMALAVLTGLSRLYLGVHYPSDVLGGAVIGAIFALLAHYFAGHSPRK